MTIAYSALTKRCVDGDTVLLSVRQQIAWFDETIVAERSFVVRILGVDCPEIRGETREAGLAAAAFTRSVLFRDGDLAEPVPVALETGGKRDVYGRLLGGVRISEGPDIGRDLATMIVEAGHGTYRDYTVHAAQLMGLPPT